MEENEEAVGNDHPPPVKLDYIHFLMFGHCIIHLLRIGSCKGAWIKSRDGSCEVDQKEADVILIPTLSVGRRICIFGREYHRVLWRQEFAPDALVCGHQRFELSGPKS
jgi:hypothetical protein